MNKRVVGVNRWVPGESVDDKTLPKSIQVFTKRGMPTGWLLLVCERRKELS